MQNPVSGDPRRMRLLYILQMAEDGISKVITLPVTMLLLVAAVS